VGVACIEIGRNTTLVAVGLRAKHENGGEHPFASSLSLTLQGKAVYRLPAITEAFRLSPSSQRQRRQAGDDQPPARCNYLYESAIRGSTPSTPLKHRCRPHGFDVRD